MAFVYILQSEMTGRFYIGSTEDLEIRLSEHLRGHSPATRGRRPWKLVHTEQFASLLTAHLALPVLHKNVDSNSTLPLRETVSHNK
jgi:putative endonuclease